MSLLGRLFVRYFFRVEAPPPPANQIEKLFIVYQFRFFFVFRARNIVNLIFSQFCF